MYGVRDRVGGIFSVERRKGGTALCRLVHGVRNMCFFVCWHMAEVKRLGLGHDGNWME